MNNPFSPKETLYRAVRPTTIYWKEDGSVSSAAFRDSGGASVDRLDGRTEPEAINFLRQHMPEPTSGIVSVTYQNCLDVNAVVRHCPINDPDNINPYHSEIHRSDTEITLTSSQCKRLVKHANIILRPANISSY